MSIENIQSIISEHIRNIDFEIYEICTSHISEKCTIVGKKEKFRGRVCKICYNYVQLIYWRKKKEEEKKEIKIIENQMKLKLNLKLT